ncbi:hypothetical protein SLNWT_2676 [Streptomyces albus]|uniref:Uncharacterized protein n=1 Tax=Streptomyces albus (strain ATCC 21838 / DSM 41398 / FERM P-419 / JCM 4703 / NBRC 107858) TaxID=1081613 RepID=A0A0B5EY67_STRA4|nr:hypothetical protein SLNWT_2676 [Streptomyces albus]AOU77362.1 hypothetical protein SLNHY_2671 [Streptomyces albus]AYN33138.1 hypothetical protein DUI70_2637 [Streptomyces albus]
MICDTGYKTIFVICTTSPWIMHAVPPRSSHRRHPSDHET